jgi:hypothetical protein
MLRVVFLIAIPAGLLLGVRAMIVGIARTQERLRASIFNLPTVGGWLTAFGITGYLLDRYSSLGSGAKLSIAAAVGLGVASGVYALIAGWAVPSARREVPDDRYLLQGHFGVVTQPIESGRDGAIRYEDEGREHVVAARMLDGSPVAAGTEIVIERVEDGVAFIELWSVIEKQLELDS